MKIAITGANGHVGCNLSRMLLEQGHELRLMYHNRKDGIEMLEAELFKADVTQYEQVKEFVKGQDVVIHLAALISIDGDPTGIITKTNTEGPKNIGRACLEAGIRRLIHFSSIHTYDPYPLDEILDEKRTLVGEKGSKYDQSKIAGQQHIYDAIEKGLDAVIITPTSIFGPYDYYPSLLGQAIIDIYNGKIPALVPGGYDFVDVRDLCKATIRAIEKGRKGEKYMLGGKYYEVKELANIIGRVGGVKVTKTVLPFWLLNILIPIFRLQSKLSGKAALFTKESLHALIASNPMISSEKAEKELGFQKTPMEESIKATLEWFKSNGNLRDHT